MRERTRQNIERSIKTVIALLGKLDVKVNPSYDFQCEVDEFTVLFTNTKGCKQTVYLVGLDSLSGFYIGYRAGRGN